ncbi:hypothetical protein CN892_27500 [Bacillus anthracis]|nr:hypothetical protein CN892_27500 [Bacillus anthracis]
MHKIETPVIKDDEVIVFHYLKISHTIMKVFYLNIYTGELYSIERDITINSKIVINITIAIFIFIL